MVSDQELKRRVEDELRWDPCFDESDIGVSVRGEKVMLSGFVHSHGERHAAEVAAKRVAGVAAVANDIEVRVSSVDERTDPEIARDVVAALHGQLPFSYDNIQIVVDKGRLVLEGELEWHYQREHAETLARRVRRGRGPWRHRAG